MKECLITEPFVHFCIGFYKTQVYFSVSTTHFTTDFHTDLIVSCTSP